MELSCWAEVFLYELSFCPLKKPPEMSKSLFYQTINTLVLSGKDLVLSRGKSSGHR